VVVVELLVVGADVSVSARVEFVVLVEFVVDDVELAVGSVAALSVLLMVSEPLFDDELSTHAKKRRDRVVRY